MIEGQNSAIYHLSTTIGRNGLNRVDVRDIADSAITSPTKSGHEGRTYDVHGPITMTSELTARTYSNEFEKEIRYGSDDLDV